MQSGEIRNRFLKFFEKRGHAVIPSASLVPENDASVLFTTAGMHPLVPYLLGEEHPKGKRLVDVQKCVRTGDLDDVGDNRHFTFFEMMGNWSLGDYFKEDAIKWSYEFLTSKEEGLGLNPNRLYVTVFEGNEDAPFDEESKKVWMSLGLPEHRIYALGAEDNWWSAGENGPCGPDTEMFYDLTEGGLGDLSKEEFQKAVEREDVVEIWNDVFMEFRKEGGKVVEKLKSKNVDTGAGLERMTAVMQGKKTAYETDLFTEIFSKIGASENTKARRVVADHLRSVVFMIADGVKPGKDERGYVPRRLIRLALTAQYLFINKAFDKNIFDEIVDAVINKYKEFYPGLSEKRDVIISIINDEVSKFSIILTDTVSDLGKLYQKKSREQEGELDGKILFNIRETHGVGFEIMKMVLSDLGYVVTSKTESEYDAEYKRNQELSRAGAVEKFKGGLAGHSEIEVRYHTATHLLHQALRDVLGSEVSQKGSNITPERLRFDFTFSRKMTDEEKQKVEETVNKKIEDALPVENTILDKEEAVKSGALHFFDQKYPDQVSVYKIGDYSKEFCGGPHVKNTSELGLFKIDKEEAVSAGVRRIKATLS